MLHFSRKYDLRVPEIQLCDNFIETCLYPKGRQLKHGEKWHIHGWAPMVKKKKNKN